MKKIEELIEKIESLKLDIFNSNINIDEQEIQSNIYNNSKKIELLKKILNSDYIIKNGHKYKKRERLIKNMQLYTFITLASIFSIIFLLLIETTGSTILLYAISILISLIASTATNRYKKRMLKENSILKPYYDLYGTQKVSKIAIEKNYEETINELNEYKSLLNELENNLKSMNKLNSLLEQLLKLKENNKKESTLEIEKELDKFTKSKILKK